MKNLKTIIAAALLTLMQVPDVYGVVWDNAEKEKKIHNQYTVQESDRLVVDNMYGKVHINTWDKNEVTVDITVIAKARTDEEAQEVLDRISFVISGNEDGSHQVYCKTVLAKMRHNIQNSNMEIDYTINAPKKIAVDITNKYGDVYLGDFCGKMNMDVSYGALNMQRISEGGKRIKVAFGSAIISYIETGILDISYSKLTINSADNIDVTNKYGKSDIGSVQHLTVDQRYGDISIGSVGKLTGDIDYANIDIDELYKSAALVLKYCGRADIKSAGNDVNLISIDAEYSNVFCHLNEGANMAVDIATSYSNVTKGKLLKSFESTDQDGNSSRHATGPVFGGNYIWYDKGENSSRCRGRIGNGKGNMTIHARYSNITFR